MSISFEKSVAEQAGTQYAIATVNGTAALHIALILAGVQADDEVLVSSLTFIAPANFHPLCRRVACLHRCRAEILADESDESRRISRTWLPMGREGAVERADRPARQGNYASSYPWPSG